MKTATIGIVDDDPRMLVAIERLLRGQGYVVRTFASAEEFLLGYREPHLDCAVLDLAMPGLGGLERQDQLRRKGALLPIVFLTGEGDIPASVRAIKAGAVNFLIKPVDAAELFNALRLALIEGNRARAVEEELAGVRERFDSSPPASLKGRATLSAASSISRLPPISE